MTYPIHRCPLLTHAKQCANTFIAKIAHAPGGYLFWYSLPAKGVYSQAVLVKWLVSTMLDILCSPGLRRAMLLACYEPSGAVAQQAKPLHRWMCTNVYNGDDGAMMRAWLLCVHGPKP